MAAPFATVVQPMSQPPGSLSATMPTFGPWSDQAAERIMFPLPITRSCRCNTPATTPWWIYVLLFIVFIIVLILIAAFVYAQMRAFPKAVRLFVAPPMAYQAANVPQSLRAPTVSLRQAAGIAGLGVDSGWEDNAAGSVA
jgi:hypothetical protein